MLLKLIFPMQQMNLGKYMFVQHVDINLDMLQMDENKLEELLVLTRDNNRMIKDIWTILHQGSPNDDFKDFVMNVIANKISQR